MHEAITDDDLVSMWKAGMIAAQAGDAKWAALIAAYFDGKPVQRNENGEPGDFDDELGDVPTDTLKKALKRVK